MASIHDISSFERVISYSFKDKSLIKQALTHSSYSNERKWNKMENNERLEFLGDAVLELVVSECLFKEHMSMLEGDLTKLRASIVCEQTLSFCSREIHLGDYVLLGKGEQATGGKERSSILSDALEAVIGAIYLDGGFTNAKEFIGKYILSDIDNKKLFFDSKTILQEIIQSKYKDVLKYDLISEEGPDHNKKFTVVATIGEKKLGSGIGRTKKAAEQEAAYHSILKMRK